MTNQTNDQEEFKKLFKSIFGNSNSPAWVHTFNKIWSYIQSYTQKKVEESYKKGWKAGNKISHPTKGGYCCACEYDLACFKAEVEKKVEEERERCIKLSDEIESKHSTTMEEWKAFKHFRNTLRDSLHREEI